MPIHSVAWFCGEVSKRRLMIPALIATITCPACRHRAVEEIPTTACLYFYTCKGCGVRLKPKRGDCCVFCSYADKCCPYCEEG